MSDCHSQDTHSWIHEGWRFVGQGQWEDALVCFTEALAMEPQNAHALHSKGLCLAALGSLAEAIVCYDQAVVNDSGLTVVWFSKALAEEQIGRTRDAANSYQRFIAVVSPQDERQIAYARGRLRELGFDEEAKADLPPSPEPIPSAPASQYATQISSPVAEAHQETVRSAEEMIAYYDRPLASLIGRIQQPHRTRASYTPCWAAMRKLSTTST